MPQGRVRSTWRTTEMATNKPCWGVETDAVSVPDSPYGRPMNCIYVPLDGPVPVVGDQIGFGPHHWWHASDPATQFDRLPSAFNRDDPER